MMQRWMLHAKMDFLDLHRWVTNDTKQSPKYGHVTMAVAHSTFKSISKVEMCQLSVDCKGVSLLTKSIHSMVQ